jgi:hypothetical protein
MKKILIIIAALIIIGGAAAWYVYTYVYNKPHPDYETAEPAISLRAKRLFTDYSNNPEDADQKFLDQVVEIEGILSEVQIVDSLVIVVFAYKFGDFGDEGIRVTMLPEYNAEAKTLSTLKPVKLKGHCTGYNGTDVIIESGSIVEEEE